MVWSGCDSGVSYIDDYKLALKSTVETTQKRPFDATTPSSLIKDSIPHNVIALVYAL